MTLSNLIGDFSNVGASENAEYPFIAITPRFTFGLIYRSNRTKLCNYAKRNILKLAVLHKTMSLNCGLMLNWIIWNLTMCKLSIIWKSDLTDKMKRSFFQAAVVSILRYGCTTWTLTKRLKKKLDGNYTRMLQAILIKSWRQHPTRHQVYGHLRLIKLSKLDEPDMQDTREAGTSS